MAKVKLIDIADQYDMEFDEALCLVIDKLPEGEVTGKGRRTWIGEAGQEILHQSLMIPEITPKHHRGNVISECPIIDTTMFITKKLGKRFQFSYLLDLGVRWLAR